MFLVGDLCLKYCFGDLFDFWFVCLRGFRVWFVFLVFSICVLFAFDLFVFLGVLCFWVFLVVFGDL